jgi:uncharacterized protein YndB with AHSA1/START domain
MASITISAPAAKVWDAITKPVQRKRWFFGVDTLTDWKVGSPIVHSGEWQGQPYTDKGVIKTFEPGRRLSHTHWSPVSGRPDKPENYETVTYTLRDRGGATEVAITEENVATPEQRAVSEVMWADVLAGLKRLVEE